MVPINAATAGIHRAAIDTGLKINDAKLEEGFDIVRAEFDHFGEVGQGFREILQKLDRCRRGRSKVGNLVEPNRLPGCSSLLQIDGCLENDMCFHG